MGYIYKKLVPNKDKCGTLPIFGTKKGVMAEMP
jgi:hypothetical protein